MSEEGMVQMLGSIPKQIDQGYRDHQSKSGCVYATGALIARLFLLAGYPFEIIFHAFMGVRQFGILRLMAVFGWFGIMALTRHSYAQSSFYDPETGIRRARPRFDEGDMMVGTHPYLFVYFSGVLLVAIVFRTWQREHCQKKYGLLTPTKSVGCISLIWRRTKLPEWMVLILIEPSIVWVIASYTKDLDWWFSAYCEVAGVSLFMLNAGGLWNMQKTADERHDQMAAGQEVQAAHTTIDPRNILIHQVSPGPSSQIDRAKKKHPVQSG